MKVEDITVTILQTPKRYTFCAAVGFIDGVPVGNAVSSRGSEVGCWWPSIGPELVPGFALKQKTVIRSSRAGTLVGQVIKGARHTPAFWRQHEGILVPAAYMLQGFTEVTAVAHRGDITAGFAKTRNLDYHAVFWQGGMPCVLAPEKGNEDTIAHGIGDGKVVGEIGRAGHRRACWWDIESRQRFDVPPEGFMSTEVSDAGRGYLVGSGWLDSKRKPLLWNKPDKQAVSVLLPSAFEAGGIASCDGDFQVGFVSERWKGPAHASLWHGSVESILDLHACLPEKYTDSDARLIEVDSDIIRIAGSVAVYSEQESHFGEFQRVVHEQRGAVWHVRLRS